MPSYKTEIISLDGKKFKTFYQLRKNRTTGVTESTPIVLEVEGKDETPKVGEIPWISLLYLDKACTVPLDTHALKIEEIAEEKK